MSSQSIKVLHDLLKKEFYIVLSPTDRAILQYAHDASKNVYELYHTEVPRSFRGRGLGDHLALAAFSFFSEDPSHPKLILSCTFLKDSALPKYPQYSNLVI